MLRIMEKIFKLYEPDDFLSKRMEFLHKKRNNLVHEGKMERISQDDRNLSKLISDYLLHFYMIKIRFKLIELK